ncbi:PAS domain S-box-containing protein [Saonia flava]|uniref:PAS domain S-box-containing protein n=1 Tax=Saonia flava TaxID=523696 RepID=A0A846R0H3_9FLAO|nr:sigma 54-interacting transcriptional regulator [Saonia flava]NJB70369.1 PAS domain S-box-containing protein [Saonia flava]
MSNTNLTLLQELKFKLGFSDVFMESIEDGLLITNTEGKIVLVNSAFGSLTGYDKHELLGTTTPFPFWPPELHEEFETGFKTMLSEELKGEFESIHLHKGGTRFPVLIFVAPIKSIEGKVIAHLALFQNVSEVENNVAKKESKNQDIFSVLNYKKKYGGLLAEKELIAQLDFTLNNITDGIISLDENWNYTYANKNAAAILGRTPSSLIGKHIWTEFPDVMRLSFYDKCLKAVETQQKQESTEFYEPYGKWFENRFYPSMKGLTIYFSDISERKEKEKEIKEIQHKLESAIRIGKIGYWSWEIENDRVFWSERMYEIYNVEKNIELSYNSVLKKIHPDDRDFHNKLVEERIKNKKNEPFEYRVLWDDETIKYVLVQMEIIEDASGKTIKMQGTVIDITERKKAELDLRLTKEFTDKLVMSMQEGLIIVNLEGEIIMVNESTCNILGYTNKELVGLNLPYPFAKPDDYFEMGKTMQKVAVGEAPSFQFEFIRKNGEKFLASFLTGNIKNDKNEVIALFGTMKDISKEIKVKNTLEESALKSSKKKEVILKLASLVGEDFKLSLNHITKLASETLNVERVSVWSFDSEKSEIFCEKLYTLSDSQFSNGVVLKKTDNPKYFNALERKQTILIKDAQKNSLTEQFAKDYLIPNNIKSLMDVFIHSTKGYYGIICFEHIGETLRNWSADEQEFATSIASIVSLMVESKERKIAEQKMNLANQELSKANSELNVLRNKLEQENIYLRNELELVFNFEEMVYGSSEFSNVLSEVEKVAATNATVLLLGESGTGKELLARAVHNISIRNAKPLIKVNCSAIPRELIESELFGHKKGSFTGAFRDKIGKFELADGGTLFLDEIGELPLDMQPKILRFLQEGEIEVVGGTGIKKLDVRVIAATNRDLKEEIEKKLFREDLFFRLNVFPIKVPPLRKRRDDIPLLVEHFVDKFNKAYSKNIKYISDAAMEKLKSYDWPGNIRELENLIERASILSNEETLIIPGFESDVQQPKVSIKGQYLSLETIQRNHIISVLEQCNWKISGSNSASSLLEVKPSTLRDKMLKLGIKKQNQ